MTPTRKADAMTTMTYCPAFAADPQPCPLTHARCQKEHIHHAREEDAMTTTTPGPWRIDGVHLVDDVSDAGPLPHAVIRSRNDMWCALVETMDSEGEANARLIAQAPAMLAGWRNLLASLDAGTARLTILDDQEHGGWREGNLDSIRAILRAVEG